MQNPRRSFASSEWAMQVVVPKIEKLQKLPGIVYKSLLERIDGNLLRNTSVIAATYLSARLLTTLALRKKKEDIDKWSYAHRLQLLSTVAAGLCAGCLVASFSANEPVMTYVRPTLGALIGWNTGIFHAAYNVKKTLKSWFENFKVKEAKYNEKVSEVKRLLESDPKHVTDLLANLQGSKETIHTVKQLKGKTIFVGEFDEVYGLLHWKKIKVRKIKIQHHKFSVSCYDNTFKLPDDDMTQTPVDEYYVELSGSAWDKIELQFKKDGSLWDKRTKIITEEQLLSLAVKQMAEIKVLDSQKNHFFVGNTSGVSFEFYNKDKYRFTANSDAIDSETLRETVKKAREENKISPVVKEVRVVVKADAWMLDSILRDTTTGPSFLRGTYNDGSATLYISAEDRKKLNLALSSLSLHSIKITDFDLPYNELFFVTNNALDNQYKTWRSKTQKFLEKTLF